MNRRNFISSASAFAVSPFAQSLHLAQAKSSANPANKPSSPAKESIPANYTLRIEPTTLEISPGVNIKTVAYNGQIPGPLLRLKMDKPVLIDVINNSSQQ